jgi:iron complex outermembrane receptor protein
MSFVLAGASVFALASAADSAAAQTAPAPAAAPADEVALGEIVVTARRKSESLQEVPQTVNAVSSETLQKLNITQFTDVQNVVPGLSLQNSTNGYQATASMRGVTFDVTTAAPLGTVATYLNDAPVQTSFLFNSLFDIGQIEVLRGPQGTTRGVSTPSGAMTATTHKPSLSEFGGYVYGTVTDQHSHNIQGALNIPIIQDVLAVRAAAVQDETDAGGVRSIHDAVRPSAKTTAERLSVSFEPNDRFNANLMYQHLDNRFMAYDQVSGPGQGANPALSPFDRASVQEGVSDARTHQDMVIANIDSRIFGQHLSYVGSYQNTKTHARNLGLTNPGDVGNQIPGAEFFNYEDIVQPQTTQEIRIASETAPDRFFDYTAGAYYSWAKVTGHIQNQQAPLTLGAFGPTSAVTGPYDPNYVLFHSSYDIPKQTQETSLFASVTLHLPFNTELSGGARHIWSIVDNSTIVNFAPGQIALPPSIASLLGFSCAPTSTYAGFCDAAVPLVAPALGLNLPATTTIHDRESETANIYQVSLSHHFSRDLLAYVNTGTSFRPGFSSPGIQGAILTSDDPVLRSLTNHPSERSRSYELGVKWTFLDGRARINADVYRQHFSNFTIAIPNINYSTGTSVANFQFTQPVDALVQGFEIDSALQVTHDWNIGLQASYADGQIEGSQVACNTFDAAGNPTFNYKGLVSFCPGGSASRLPYWNATLTSEYVHEVRDDVDGFVRGLFAYYPENKNRMEADFTVPSYGLLSLYAGLRSHDGAWEVQLFAKNALRNNTVLDRSPVQASVGGLLVPGLGYEGTFPAESGYYATQVTPRREVGLSVRYAWGAR